MCSAHDRRPHRVPALSSGPLPHLQVKVNDLGPVTRPGSGRRIGAIASDFQVGLATQTHAPPSGSDKAEHKTHASQCVTGRTLDDGDLPAEPPCTSVHGKPNQRFACAKPAHAAPGCLSRAEGMTKEGCLFRACASLPSLLVPLNSLPVPLCPHCLRLFTLPACA